MNVSVCFWETLPSTHAVHYLCRARSIPGSNHNGMGTGGLSLVTSIKVGWVFLVCQLPSSESRSDSHIPALVLVRGGGVNAPNGTHRETHRRTVPPRRRHGWWFGCAPWPARLVVGHVALTAAGRRWHCWHTTTSCLNPPFPHRSIGSRDIGMLITYRAAWCLSSRP